jgi:hypothetical protein
MKILLDVDRGVGGSLYPIPFHGPIAAITCRASTVVAR